MYTFLDIAKKIIVDWIYSWWNYLACSREREKIENIKKKLKYIENRMKSSNICVVASQKRENRDNGGEEICD